MCSSESEVPRIALAPSFDLFEEFKLIFPERNSDYSNLSNVLILGCGHVEGLYHALRNPKINFDCIDISNNAILSANENSNNLKLKNVNFQVQDINSYSSKTKYDVIFSTNVLQYVEDLLLENGWITKV